MVKKISVIIQARINSTRLPEKIIKKFNNITFIELLLKRLRFSKYIENIIIASGPLKKNYKLKYALNHIPVNIFFGPENNVLKRFYKAATKNKLKHIIRITSDCPLMDFKLLDKIILEYLKNKYDYFSNINPRTFPDGMDIEIFSYKTLKKTFQLASSKYDKEHVTSFMRGNKIFKQGNFYNKINLSNYRITLDTKKDLKIILFIISKFYPKIDFSLNQITKILKKI